MFFRKPKRSPDLDEKLERAQEMARNELVDAVNSLRTEIDELVTTIHEKDEIIQQQRIELSRKDAVIHQQGEKIKHLEVLLRDDEVYVDGETKLFNRNYYEKHLKGRLTDNYSVLTIKIQNFDVNNPMLVSQRMELSDLVLQFCENHNDIPMMWDDNTIKLFIDAGSKPIVKEEIVDLLRKNLSDHRPLTVSFKHKDHDTDLH